MDQRTQVWLSAAFAKQTWKKNKRGKMRGMVKLALQWIH
jgi:hypothetical protein